MCRWLVGALPLILAVSAHAQLTQEERRGIEQGLWIGNLTPSDLQWERRQFTDKYRLPLVDFALEQPIDAADRIMRLHRAALSPNVARLLGEAGAQLPLRDPSAPAPAPEPPQGPMVLPGKFDSALAEEIIKLVAAIDSANSSIKKALAKLTPAETRELIEGLPTLAVEEPSVHFSFVRGVPPDRDRILSLLDKVELRRIRLASEVLTAKVQQALPKLSAIAKSPSFNIETQRLRVKGLTVVLGGLRSDIHTDTGAALMIDFGGNDRYTGRPGVGVGYASVQIDLGGNDVYDTDDLSCGVGLLGIGISWDLAGDDVYRTRSVALGCGLGGVGIHVDEAGSDRYSSLALAQGFGMFGIGLQVDGSGDDFYDAKLYAQGAARTSGVGWLADRAGDDTYRLGGLVVSAPLFADVHYSFGQGYAAGFREDTGGVSGGIGLLTDGGGDDAYVGETYCQAASYWFSLGSLFDVSGHDTYTAYHYAQASAMHMTAAYLFDLAGDDGYLVKFGASHAIGHDYGVAMLLDRAGNDIYTARDSRPGIGNANGIGIFVDAAGDDRYQGPPGVGNGARGFGSLGLFVDLSGADLYRTGFGDNEAMTAPTWGYALDLGPAPSTTAPAVLDKSVTKPRSIPRPSDAELERLYALAIQWGVGTAQKEVAESVDRLIAIGLPALEWMVAKKLPSVNRLSRRAFVAVTSAIGDAGKTLVAKQIASSDTARAREALGICVDGAFKEAGPYVPTALKVPVLQRQAVRAAGATQSLESAPLLIQLMGSKDRGLALSAFVSLSQIPNAGWAIAENQATAPDLMFRKTAFAILAKSPERSLPVGKRLAGDSDERIARIGVELLGVLGTADSIKAAGSWLSDGRAGVRLQACLALAGRCPPEFVDALNLLRKDSDPIVRAAALHALGHEGG